MSRQPKREASEPINELIHHSLSLLEQFKTTQSSEDRSTIHDTVKGILMQQIPQHPGYVEFVNKSGVFYQSYLQMCALLKSNETVVLESRFQNLRRNSHGSVSARGSAKALDALKQQAARNAQNAKNLQNGNSEVNRPIGSVNGSITEQSRPMNGSIYGQNGNIAGLSATNTSKSTPAYTSGTSRSSETLNGSDPRKNAHHHDEFASVDPTNPANAGSSGSSGYSSTSNFSRRAPSPSRRPLPYPGNVNSSWKMPEPSLNSTTPQSKSSSSSSSVFATGNFIFSPSILYNKIKVSKVLVIDFRPYREFKQGHISCPLIVNLDPETLSHFNTIEQIQDSLIVSPAGGFDEFCQLPEVDLVCVYDNSSSTINETRNLDCLFKMFRVSGFQPYLLRDGFRAWQSQYPGEIEPPQAPANYSRFGSSSSVLNGSSPRARASPQFKPSPLLSHLDLSSSLSLEKQGSPPLPMAPPPPIPPLAPAHKTVHNPSHNPSLLNTTVPRLPPKEEIDWPETRMPSPSIPRRTYTAPVSSASNRASQIYSDIDSEDSYLHNQFSPPKNTPNDDLYQYAANEILAVPDMPVHLPPPVPKHLPQEPPRIPKADHTEHSGAAGLIRTRSSSLRNPILNGYTDAPAKLSLPSLRVPKLLANSQRGLSPVSSSSSPSKKPFANGTATTSAGTSSSLSARGSLEVKRSPSPVRLSSPVRQATPPYIDEDVPPYLMSNTGLRNLGNTCYMNCIIQCLVGFPKLVESFNNGSFVNHVNYRSKLGHRGEVARVFAELVRAIFHSNANGGATVVAPVALKQMAGMLRPDDFAGYEQQDCQDFLTFLLDGLHEDLNLNGDRPKQGELNEYEEKIREQMGIRAASAVEWERYLEGDTSLIVDLFQGQYLSRLQCLTCKHTSTTYNAFSSLSLPIVSPKLLGQHTTLKACFDEFVKPEILVGDNAWYCPHCKTKRRTVKTLQISRLPPILVIHLKRFKRTSSGVNKLETAVDYPVKGLDLTRYWPQSRQHELNAKEAEILSKIPSRGQQAPFIYDLRAVTLHDGTLKGGHYTAIVQKPGKGWLYYDDANVYPVKEQAAVNKSAYVLFYRRRM